MARPSILRDRIKDHLLEQIQNGGLQVGKTINLAALSRDTGVSVTPIREALSQLEQAQVSQSDSQSWFCGSSPIQVRSQESD